MQEVADKILHARYFAGKSYCLGQVAPLAMNHVIDACAVIVRGRYGHQRERQCQCQKLA
jgi:hypothetical protein